MQRREFLVHSARVLGVAASSSLMAGALAAEPGVCKPAQSCLDKAQLGTLATLVELIIPATDTPGAVEAGVVDFIDLIVSDWYTPKERKIFLGGLLALDQYCMEQFGATCQLCLPAQQVQALQYFETLAAGYVPARRSMFQRSFDESAPFFTKLKELTTFGYFTSEVGARQALSYNPVPGQYLGDYPLDRVGKAWSS